MLAVRTHRGHRPIPFSEGAPVDHADYTKLNRQLAAYRQEVVKRAAVWINEQVEGITIDNTLTDLNAYCLPIPRTISVDRGVFRVRLTSNSSAGKIETIYLPASLLDGIEMPSDQKSPSAEQETRFPASALTGLLNEAGFGVLVQQTGGNTATIYATRGGITMIGGPGEYNWVSPAESVFDSGDFYVGVVDNEDGGKRVYPGASMAAIALVFSSEADAAS